MKLAASWGPVGPIGFSAAMGSVLLGLVRLCWFQRQMETAQKASNT